MVEPGVDSMAGKLQEAAPAACTFEEAQAVGPIRKYPSSRIMDACRI